VTADDELDRSIQDVKAWVWASQSQYRRMQESAAAELEHLGWPPKIDYVERSKVFARFSTDQHLLLVCLGNVVTAVGRAEELHGRTLPLSGEIRDGAVLLRNLYEHWKNERPAFPDGPVSGPRYAERFPGASPWSVVFHPDGRTMLGGTLHLEGVYAALDVLEVAILAWKE
jgi:hypothetical protein